jgi:hypothetical protein
MNHWDWECEILYGVTYLCKTFIYFLTITKMVTMQNFEVTTYKFNMVNICTSGSYAQKCTTKLYNY